MKRLLFLLFVVTLLYSCKSEKKKIYEKVRNEIQSILLDKKLHSYTPISYSPVYYTTSHDSILIDLIYEDLTEDEKKLYLSCAGIHFTKPAETDEEQIKRWISLSVLFPPISSKSEMDLEDYKEIRYIDNIIRNNNIKPSQYIVFHQFKFKDKYDDAHTEWLVFLFWSDKINDPEDMPIYGTVSNEVKMKLNKN